MSQKPISMGTPITAANFDVWWDSMPSYHQVRKDVANATTKPGLRHLSSGRLETTEKLALMNACVRLKITIAAD